MTYEGSTTHPGCWESTVWIILNKPIYITKQEVGQSKLGSLASLKAHLWQQDNLKLLPSPLRIGDS